LWAGDGEHEGVTDVERLPNYDIYLCLGLSGSQFDKNVERLTDSQTICIVNVHDKEQMARFHAAFAGSFYYIDADYKGNTPTLPLTWDAFRLAAGAKGIVTAGFAPGYVTPAMVKAGEAAVAAGVKLVLSSRAGSGRTFRTQRGDKSGFISADNLTPQKARILLSLALTMGLDNDGIRRVFATY
jgi:hypothetical protein